MSELSELFSLSNFMYRIDKHRKQQPFVDNLLKRTQYKRKLFSRIIVITKEVWDKFIKLFVEISETMFST